MSELPLLSEDSPTPAPAPTPCPASPMVCYAIRLPPGEELKGVLAEFTSHKEIRAGFIVSCVGSVRDVSLRLAGAEPPAGCSPSSSSAAAAAAAIPPPAPQENFTAGSHYDQLQEYHQHGREEEEQPMLRTGPDARFEICSLVGTLSPEGLHLHASLADEKGALCGGHLVRATVHTTAEIVIGVASSLEFSREMDPRTGFKELVVSGPDTSRYENFLCCNAILVIAVTLVTLVLVVVLVGGRSSVR
ncbi:unnamed protein product [Ectocarpus sp. 12 AP-2014]